MIACERTVALARGLFLAGGGEVDEVAWPHDDFVHAWWVEPGRLLAGEYPGNVAAPTLAREKVNLLVDAGVRTFVDLTTPADRLLPYRHLVHEIGTTRGLDSSTCCSPFPIST